MVNKCSEFWRYVCLLYTLKELSIVHCSPLVLPWSPGSIFLLKSLQPVDCCLFFFLLFLVFCAGVALLFDVLKFPHRCRFIYLPQDLRGLMNLRIFAFFSSGKFLGIFYSFPIFFSSLLLEPIQEYLNHRISTDSHSWCHVPSCGL